MYLYAHNYRLNHFPWLRNRMTDDRFNLLEQIEYRYVVATARKQLLIHASWQIMW